MRIYFLKSIDIYAQKAYNKTQEGQEIKTKDLIELLEKNGWKFKRHRETDENLAKAIIKRRGLK